MNLTILPWITITLSCSKINLAHDTSIFTFTMRCFRRMWTTLFHVRLDHCGWWPYLAWVNRRCCCNDCNPRLHLRLRCSLQSPLFVFSIMRSANSKGKRIGISAFLVYFDSRALTNYLSSQVTIWVVTIEKQITAMQWNAVFTNPRFSKKTSFTGNWILTCSWFTEVSGRGSKVLWDVRDELRGLGGVDGRLYDSSWGKSTSLIILT